MIILRQTGVFSIKNFGKCEIFQKSIFPFLEIFCPGCVTLPPYGVIHELFVYTKLKKEAIPILIFICAVLPLFFNIHNYQHYNHSYNSRHKRPLHNYHNLHHSQRKLDKLIWNL